MSAFSNPLVRTPLSGATRAWRSLGNNGVAPRRLYFIDFPLFLSITGVLAWIMPTDMMLFLSSLVAAIVGAYTLWDIAIRRGPIRFSHVVCIANTVGYGGAAINSWLSIHRGSMDLATFFGKD